MLKLTVAEQESLTGFFIATKLHHPKTEYSLEDLRQYGHPHINCAFNIDELYKKANEKWLSSARTVADTLVKFIGQKSLIVNHRTKSKFVENISQRAKVLIKESDHSMNLDKWNPADVWLVHKDLLNIDFKQFGTIQELNAWLEDMYHAEKVFGVSLKLVGKKAKAEVINKGTNPNIEYKSHSTGKVGFLNSLDGVVEYNLGEIRLRNFGRPESISAEIYGDLAAGGKVGSSQLFAIMRRFDKNFKTVTHQEITHEYSRNASVVYKRLYEAALRLDPIGMRQMRVDEFITQIERKDNALNYVISMVQVSDVLTSISKMDTAHKNDVMSAIISYASSATKISSVFIKVHGDKPTDQNLNTKPAVQKRGAFVGTVFHGSNSIFSKFDQRKARIANDFYGGGIAYFTDDYEVGKSYARTMSRKEGEPIVYTVRLTLRKVFDVEQTFTGKDLLDILPTDLDKFARGAGLFVMGKDTFLVLAMLKKGTLELSGDQVFKGLSGGMVNTAGARSWLIKKGYDGLRYNGGLNMNVKQHNVYLVYKTESIRIEKRTRIVKR